MSTTVIEGNDAVTGHIISTTIGGKNGEPKQVRAFAYPPFLLEFQCLVKLNSIPS